MLRSLGGVATAGGVVTLAWFSQRRQRDQHGNQREQEASQVVRANQGVAFHDEFAAHCFHGACDVAAGCLRLIGHSALGPTEAAVRIGAAFASVSASPRPSPGGVLSADSFPRWGSTHGAGSTAAADWGQATLDAGVGIFNPAYDDVRAEWASRGGQATAALGPDTARARGVQQTDMAAVRYLQAQQEARGGPVVGSRKRKAVQRMNL